MTPVVRVKDGVTFGTIAPAGFRLLGAIERAARQLGRDVTITSGDDGTHSGPTDPHHRGAAYDVRAHDLPDDLRARFLWLVLMECRDDEPLPVPAGEIPQSLVTNKFFGFLEAPDTPNMHFHFQLRKGAQYP